MIKQFAIRCINKINADTLESKHVEPKEQPEPVPEVEVEMNEVELAELKGEVQAHRRLYPNL